MGLEQIITDYENEKEPLLDEMVEYFKHNELTPSNMQRRFKIGLRRANRAKRQLDKLNE